MKLEVFANKDVEIRLSNGNIISGQLPSKRDDSTDCWIVTEVTSEGTFGAVYVNPDHVVTVRSNT